MPDTSIVHLEPGVNFLHATITCEKVGQREAQILEAEVKQAAQGKQWRVLMNAGQVTMLASMGLGAIVNLHKLTASSGGRLVIYGMSDELLGLLKVTHLDRILHIVKSREDAIKDLK